jgi:hypothetical protein
MRPPNPVTLCEGGWDEPTFTHSGVWDEGEPTGYLKGAAVRAVPAGGTAGACPAAAAIIDSNGLNGAGDPIAIKSGVSSERNHELTVDV